MTLATPAIPRTRPCLDCGVEPGAADWPTYFDGRVDKRYHHTRCRPCYRKYVTAKSNARYHKTGKATRIKSLYGITLDERDARLASQGGCGICGSDDPRGSDWHIDHDHSCCPGPKSCGECVRGVLCGFCNRGLGQFLDSPELLEKAMTYLIENGSLH